MGIIGLSYMMLYSMHLKLETTTAPLSSNRGLELYGGFSIMKMTGRIKIKYARRYTYSIAKCDEKYKFVFEIFRKKNNVATVIVGLGSDFNWEKKDSKMTKRAIDNIEMFIAQNKIELFESLQ